jgi:hypothetical protein
MALCQREQRVTYRTLRQVLGVDDDCLHAVRDELLFRRLARYLQHAPADRARGFDMFGIRLDRETA